MSQLLEYMRVSAENPHPKGDIRPGQPSGSKPRPWLSGECGDALYSQQVRAVLRLWQAPSLQQVVGYIIGIHFTVW